jgi:hypothetical protein
MKRPVDIAETLEADADKLPDLVFDKTGKLVSGKPSASPKQTPTAPAKQKTRAVRRPR